MNYRAMVGILLNVMAGIAAAQTVGQPPAALSGDSSRIDYALFQNPPISRQPLVHISARQCD